MSTASRLLAVVAVLSPLWLAGLACSSPSTPSPQAGEAARGQEKVTIQRLRAMLVATAAADAIAAQTEGLTSEIIRSQYSTRITGFLPQARAKDNIVALGYQPGFITDDTLFTLINIRAVLRDLRQHGAIQPWTGNRAWLELVEACRGKYLEPISPLWSADGRRRAALLKQNPAQRIAANGCSCTMGISPVGIKNRLHRERIFEDVSRFIQFQHSPETLCATTALAYAWAEAMDPRASIASILASARRGAEVSWTGKGPSPVLRNIDRALAVKPLGGDDTKLARYLGKEITLTNFAQDAVPVALALLLHTGADAYRSAVIATNLGGDTDSYAAVAAGLCALHRGENFPAEIKERLRINRIDFDDYARQLYEISILGERDARGASR